MTLTTNEPTTGDVVREDLVSITIDGIQLQVPKDTLVIRAAELVGIEIPRFCDHPLLDPVGACRQCLVEVEGQRKPMASCTITVTDGMVVRTHLSSSLAERSQRGMLELLLINHPLDCPVCDKGGECPLQNQAMSHGQAETRFHDVKRTFPKPIAISSQVLLDRERCVLCARCTRFSKQIAGDPFIELLERGALQQVGIYEDQPFESYFSGNTVQICPVGALTGASYRFRARPFDLVSAPSACEHCAAGCALRVDHRRGKVLRRMAAEDSQVNEEWNCDKGRWAFTYTTAPDRLTVPLVRNDEGELVITPWPQALAVAAEGLRAAGGVGVLPGGRLTLEDAFAYSKFARAVLGTDDIDGRARPISGEEQAFLSSTVAGSPMTVTYADIEKAPAVLLVGVEAEEECPILFLRLRKAAMRRGLKVFSLAPFATPGLTKVSGTLVATVPGQEAGALANLAPEVSGAMSQDGALIFVGERLASSPGAFTAALALAQSSGARLAWVPRRAGERGALDAGLLPGLLPGGRPINNQAARVEVEGVWGGLVPQEPGRDLEAIIEAAASGGIGALVVGGVDVDDLPDPAAARAALSKAFVVSLELRPSSVTEHANVVFPVAAVVEKPGTFVDWEGRKRTFPKTLVREGAVSDHKVLDMLANEFGIPLDTATVEAARSQLEALGNYGGARSAEPSVSPPALPEIPDRSVVLATWHYLLDNGSLQDREEHLAGTARASVLRISSVTAASIGATDGATVTLTSDRGSVSLPLEITEMPDGVAWVPTNARDCAVRPTLAAGSGAVVAISSAAPQEGGTE